MIQSENPLEVFLAHLRLGVDLEIAKNGQLNRGAMHHIVDYLFDHPVESRSPEVLAALSALTDAGLITEVMQNPSKVKRVKEVESDLPIPEWNETNQQKALIMGQGTIEQREESLRFLTKHFRSMTVGN